MSSVYTWSRCCLACSALVGSPAMPKTVLRPSASLRQVASWPSRHPTSRMRKLLAGTVRKNASWQRAPRFSEFSLVHIRIRAEVLQDFLAVFLVDHEIHALPAVTAFDPALGADKMFAMTSPIPRAGFVPKLEQ